ncbi:unnamed protein product [Notodromas monacha]|uniref:Dual oxidase maturation factor 1 n=1 Tax=Notodromas monacha TaxID=399045 RepID=A0A7R9BH67_9CRUS|nr:unnamed protein product [Notodromas monacha]CAG0915154.1 unnamed protein product [Notodromas monacha]
MFPYSIFEPFVRVDNATRLWFGTYSKKRNWWYDESNFRIWLFLFCLALVGCFNAAGRRLRRGHALLWSATLGIILASNLFGMYGGDWLKGTLAGEGSFSRFDNVRHVFKVDVHIGLRGMNVTVQVREPGEKSHWMFNEYLPWAPAYVRRDLTKEAKLRGIPDPILSVYDYYDAPDELSLGANLKQATQLSEDLMWFSFASTVYLICLLAFVPSYIYIAFLVNGIFMASSFAVFLFYDPISAVRKIHIHGMPLEVTFGWTSYLVAATAILLLFFGFGLWGLQWFRRTNMHSPWETDLDTPFYWKDKSGVPEEQFHLEGATILSKLRHCKASVELTTFHHGEDLDVSRDIFGPGTKESSIHTPMKSPLVDGSKLRHPNCYTPSTPLEPLAPPTTPVLGSLNESGTLRRRVVPSPLSIETDSDSLSSRGRNHDSPASTPESIYP